MEKKIKLNINNSAEIKNSESLEDGGLLSLSLNIKNMNSRDNQAKLSKNIKVKK